MLDEIQKLWYNYYSEGNNNSEEEVLMVAEKVEKVEKVKKVKVTEREIVRGVLIEALKATGANLVGRTKEGLVLEVNGNHVVVRTILKKAKIEKKDLVETL
jgi:hypothetical protein